MPALLIAIVLLTAAQAFNFEYAGQAISIMSLGLSVPHNLFLRDHSRSLDFLQTSYLVLSCGNSSENRTLDYSVISFFPSFINREQKYFTNTGGRLSFVLVFLGALILTFGIYRIEKYCGQQLTFTQPWLILRTFIDWAYLILFRLTIKQFVEIIVHGSQIASSVVEFSVMCLVFVVYIIYHILLMSVDLGLSEKPTPEQLTSQRRSRLTELVTYLKSVTLCFILTFSEVFEIRTLQYCFIGVIIMYLAAYMLWYDFVGMSEKVLFVLTQCAMNCNIGLILNNQNADIAYIGIIAVFVGETLMDVYKFYRALMYRKKTKSAVHPEPLKQQIAVVPIQQQKDLDMTEVQLEVVQSKRRVSWRKRSRNLFDMTAVDRD